MRRKIDSEYIRKKRTIRPLNNARTKKRLTTVDNNDKALWISIATLVVSWVTVLGYMIYTAFN